MVCKYWEGTTHVNQKDNVKFLYNDSVDEIKHVISELLFTNAYFVMQQNAKIVKKNFLYSDIAYRSIN